MKRNKKIIKEFLVLWKNYPVEDAMWIQANQFSHPGQLGQLQTYMEEDQPQEEKF